MRPETVGEVQHPNDAAKAWQEMVASLSRADSSLASREVPEELMRAGTDETAVAEVAEEAPEEEQEIDPVEKRMRALNQERLKRSEHELATSKNLEKASPEAYWKATRIMMTPDFQGLKDVAEGYFKEKGYSEDQGERVNLILHTALNRMAQQKVAENKKIRDGEMQAHSSIEEMQKVATDDMLKILEAYYGDGEDYNAQAKAGGPLTDDERVIWLMAQLPDNSKNSDDPEAMSPVKVVQDYPGRFKNETTTEFYSRLKNYLDPEMREWQINQTYERGDEVIDKGGEVDSAEIERLEKVHQARENLKVAEELLAMTDLTPETRASVEDSKAKIVVFLQKNQNEIKVA